MRLSERQCQNCGHPFYAAGFSLCRLCWPARESPTGLERARLKRQADAILKAKKEKKPKAPKRPRSRKHKPTLEHRRAAPVPLAAFEAAPRQSLGFEEIMALPLRPCTACRRLTKKGECVHYGRKMPNPESPCRCAHFRPA